MDYEWRKSRRRSIAITIDETGKLIVRSPMFTSRRQVENLLKERRGWIEEKQQMMKERGDTPSILEHDESWYIERAKILYPKRIAMYEPLVGVHAGKIRISGPKTRWGSCNIHGDIMLHWRLMLADVDILDYVIVHELCHVHHMDHSDAFWHQVERVLPDYKQRRRWLRENGWRLR